MLHCTWNRIFCLFAAMALLLAGCADTGTSTDPGDKSNTNTSNPFVYNVGGAQTAFDALPRKGRDFFCGAAEAGAGVATEEGTMPASDKFPGTFTYDGNPVSFDFCFAATDPDADMELGVQLYLNGVPQPFTVGKARGITPCETPVAEYRFDAYGEFYYSLPITFTPVCGKAGESLVLYVVFTTSPSYKPTEEEELSAWLQVTSYPIESIVMEVDAPTQQTMEAMPVDNGYTWDESAYDPSAEKRIMAFTLKNPLFEAAYQEYLAVGGAVAGAEMDPAFVGKSYIMRFNEEGLLDLTLQAITETSLRCLVQMRLDGQVVPVFDGKYFAEIVMPNTGGKQWDVADFTLDLSAYPDAHAVQLVVIPIPVPGTVYEWGVTNAPLVFASDVAWIRYDGE